MRAEKCKDKGQVYKLLLMLSRTLSQCLQDFSPYGTVILEMSCVFVD